MERWVEDNIPSDKRIIYRAGLMSALTYEDNVWDEGLYKQTEESNELYTKKISKNILEKISKRRSKSFLKTKTI